MSRWSSPNLTWEYSGTFWHNSTSSYNGKALNCGTSLNGGSHGYIAEVFKDASIKSDIRANIGIISNDNFVAIHSLEASKMCIVLNYGVFADLNCSSVTSNDSTVP